MRKVFEDTKGVIKSLKYKDSHYNDQKKTTTGQTMVYKTLHRKLKFEQHESHSIGDGGVDTQVLRKGYQFLIH